jgi:hypothetical protein
VHRLERICLNIRFEERQIGQSRGFRIRAACVDEGATAVKTNDRTGWPDAPRKFNRGIAPTASNIQYAVAAMEWQRRKHFCAMQVKTSGEDVPPRVEFWSEYSVPEINILIVGLDCLRDAHNQDACLLKVIFLNAIAASAACLSVPHLRNCPIGDFAAA